mgnify:CR=1 FL=1
MAEIIEQLALAYSESPLPSWVLGSLLAYAIATNGLWLANRRGLRYRRLGDWLIQVARFLFYVGMPYLALGGWPRPPLSGLLIPEDFGLVGLGGRWPPTRWLGAAGTAVGLGLVAFLFLLVAWAYATRSSDEAQFRFAPRPWWALLIDVIYLQVHWAFYRGALAVTLGNIHAGVFWGLGLVYLEWAANPFWRRSWRLEGKAAGRWLRAALALVSASIFFLTRNLWVCLGIHAMLELALWRLGRQQPAALANPSDAVEL